MAADPSARGAAEPTGPPAVDETDDSPPRPVLELDEVVYAYPDGTRALDGVSLRLAPGERVALLGPNGAGKSTLLLHLNGILLPTSGSVRVAELEVTRRTLREVRVRVGLVFQDPDDQLFMTTVREDVAFGPLNMGLPDAEVDARVQEALRAVDLLAEAGKPAQHLSYGQRKRAALATILAMSPALMVLDEPSSDLDPRARRQMLHLLDALECTLLVATHDMDLAWELCERAVILDAGRVVADGPAERLLTDSPLLEAHGLEVPPSVRPRPTMRRRPR